MGSLQNASYRNAGILAVVLVICGGILFCQARELNAFAVGEDNARHIGVNVRRTKLLLLDEPTNHLDLVYKKQVFALIADWVRQPVLSEKLTGLRWALQQSL